MDMMAQIRGGSKDECFVIRWLQLQCYSDTKKIAAMSQIMGVRNDQSLGTIFFHYSNSFNKKTILDTEIWKIIINFNFSKGTKN